MNKNELTTPQETFETIIIKALPDCQKEFIANFDDVYFGFDVSPRPGYLIQLKISIDNHTRICINKYYINTFRKELVCQTIFRGNIPENANGKIDFDFIECLLKNWQNIG